MQQAMSGAEFTPLWKTCTSLRQKRSRHMTVLRKSMSDLFTDRSQPVGCECPQHDCHYTVANSAEGILDLSEHFSRCGEIMPPPPVPAMVVPTEGLESELQLEPEPVLDALPGLDLLDMSLADTVDNFDNNYGIFPPAGPVPVQGMMPLPDVLDHLIQDSSEDLERLVLDITLEEPFTPTPELFANPPRLVTETTPQGEPLEQYLADKMTCQPTTHLKYRDFDYDNMCSGASHTLSEAKFHNETGAGKEHCSMSDFLAAHQEAEAEIELWKTMAGRCTHCHPKFWGHTICECGQCVAGCCV